METAAEMAQSGADGFSLVDGGTVLVGLLFVVAKIVFRYARGKPAVAVRLCAVDFLNGIVVVPFLMMVGDAARPNSCNTSTIPGSPSPLPA